MTASLGSADPTPAARWATAVRRSGRAEWFRLTRPRSIRTALATTALAAAAVTAALLLSLDEAAPAPRMSLEFVATAGPQSVTLDALGYGAIVLFAVFTSWAAGGSARGTHRTELLHQPIRGALAVGAFLARWAVAGLLVLLSVAAGTATTAALAAPLGLDPGAWATPGMVRALAVDAAVVLGYTAGWGLLGTLLGTAVRSVPLALGLGLAWAGPVENILGDDWGPAARWFPGLLLRGLLVDSSVVERTTSLVTLGAYAAVCLIVIGALGRRDVTR